MPEKITIYGRVDSPGKRIVLKEEDGNVRASITDDDGNEGASMLLDAGQCGQLSRWLGRRDAS